MLRKGGTRERNAHRTYQRSYASLSEEEASPQDLPEVRDSGAVESEWTQRRMPNKGYPLVAANFIKKFSLRVNENDVIRDLKRIRVHCVKHGPQPTGEIGSIRDVSLYEKLKTEFNGLMTSQTENPTVLRDKRNQRYTEHSINKEAVSMLNVIITEYLIDHPVNDMTHLAIIYQTAQDCHDMVAWSP
ncbi:reverse transcriptase homolog [Babesia caballi]|uniref:Reverse transcriptase homolog n=1 Tax=Babesia caballi TaxID=5871 RepID=A0AAV4LUL1_BABCB|nr:reverse transcriptase homolog [Babesia caballi]